MPIRFGIRAHGPRPDGLQAGAAAHTRRDKVPLHSLPLSVPQCHKNACTHDPTTARFLRRVPAAPTCQPLVWPLATITRRQPPSPPVLDAS